jgi:hypothetical protein
MVNPGPLAHQKKGRWGMRVKLSGYWALTTDHSQSSYGRPVLVHEGNDNIYGPGDLVGCKDGFMLARAFVEQKALGLRLTEKQAQLIAKFVD